MCSYKYFSPWILWPKPYAWHLEKRVSLSFILRTLSLWNIHIIIGYIRGFNGPMPLIWMLRSEGTCIILSNLCSIREDVFWSKWSRLFVHLTMVMRVNCVQTHSTSLHPTSMSLVTFRWTPLELGCLNSKNICCQKQLRLHLDWVIWFRDVFQIIYIRVILNPSQFEFVIMNLKSFSNSFIQIQTNIIWVQNRTELNWVKVYWRDGPRYSSRSLIPKT